MGMGAWSARVGEDVEGAWRLQVWEGGGARGGMGITKCECFVWISLNFYIML